MKMDNDDDEEDVEEKKKKENKGNGIEGKRKKEQFDRGHKWRERIHHLVVIFLFFILLGDMRKMSHRTTESMNASLIFQLCTP